MATVFRSNNRLAGGFTEQDVSDLTLDEKKAFMRRVKEYPVGIPAWAWGHGPMADTGGCLNYPSHEAFPEEVRTKYGCPAVIVAAVNGRSVQFTLIGIARWLHFWHDSYESGVDKYCCVLEKCPMSLLERARKMEHSEVTCDEKLETLAGIEGFEDSLAMLEEYQLESVVPGICMNFDCDYSTECEPDSESGWCEVCETGTVKSCMVLANII